MILALLPTIAILMDQQIAAVIVNRKENQLKVILPRLRQQFVVPMCSVALERVRLPSRSSDCHDLHSYSFDRWSSKRFDGRLSRDMFV